MKLSRLLVPFITLCLFLPGCALFSGDGPKPETVIERIAVAEITLQETIKAATTYRRDQIVAQDEPGLVAIDASLVALNAGSRTSDLLSAARDGGRTVDLSELDALFESTAQLLVEWDAAGVGTENTATVDAVFEDLRRWQTVARAAAAIGDIDAASSNVAKVTSGLAALRDLLSKQDSG